MNVDAVGQRVEDLLDDIAGRDPVAGELSEELVRELLALYGAGLGRILDRMRRDAPETLGELAADPLVGGLLALHDLHPATAVDRVEAALDSVRPYLASHGGGVQLLGVVDGVAHLRLQGSCDGCGSSEVTLRHAVEGAVLDAAPELAGIEVDGVVPAAGAGLIPPEALSRRTRRDDGWQRLPNPPSGPDGAVAATEVDGAGVAVVRLAGELFAYRDACGACGGSLAGGRAQGDVIACPACSASYDARRAGRAVDGGPGLEPVPLLADTDGVRVAVGALR